MLFWNIVVMNRFLKIIFYGIALNYIGFLLMHKISFQLDEEKENLHKHDEELEEYVLEGTIKQNDLKQNDSDDNDTDYP